MFLHIVYGVPQPRGSRKVEVDLECHSQQNVQGGGRGGARSGEPHSLGEVAVPKIPRFPTSQQLCARSSKAGLWLNISETHHHKPFGKVADSTRAGECRRRSQNILRCEINCCFLKPPLKGAGGHLKNSVEPERSPEGSDADHF